MDTKLKAQLLAAMKAIQEVCDNATLSDADFRELITDANAETTDALAALEAAPVELSLEEAFAQAHAAIAPLLGEKCFLSVDREMSRYTTGVVKQVWVVSACSDHDRWRCSMDCITFDEALKSVLGKIVKAAL